MSAVISEEAPGALGSGARASSAICASPLWTLPNVLSLSRMALLPALWWCALSEYAFWLGAGVLLAGATDVADGWLARRWSCSTALGARLDSIADNLMIASVLAWLLVLVPELRSGAEQALWIAGLASWALFLSIGLMKFGRLANLHLWSAKLSAVIFCSFVVATFTVGFERWLYFLAVGSWIGTNLEGALVLLVRKEVDEHIGSFLRFRKARR